MTERERRLREEKFYVLRRSRLVRFADWLNDVAWFSKAPKFITRFALWASYFIYERTGCVEP